MNPANSAAKQDWLASLKALLQQKIEPCQRFAIVEQLRNQLFLPDGEINDQYLGRLSPEEIRRALKLSQQLFDWVAIRVLVPYLLKLKPPQHALSTDQLHSLLLLGAAHQQLGDFEQASLNDAQTLVKHNKQFDQYQRRLQARMACLPDNLTLLRSDTITLTPMHTHHGHDYLLQYFDPAIGDLCNLPQYKNIKDWQNWFENYTWPPETHMFAIIHHHWGFIGSICLEAYDDKGFFYFWLGKDFRGKGYAQEALRVLLQWAEPTLVIDSFYTRAFVNNVASQKAMLKQGFKALPLKAKPIRNNKINETEIVYYRGVEKTNHDIQQELTRFLKSMDADFVVEPTEPL